MRDSTFIGLDVRKATISVAIAQGERGGEVRNQGTVPHQPDHVRKLVERLHFCYNASPCGYGLHRQPVEMGHDCIVVAPSLIPVKAGDRVKTDRRGAVMLAKLHRAGELTAVWVPDAAHEAMRDLVRARATAMRVPGKARQHRQGFLLRHGRIYPGKKGWTVAYRRWLTMVRFLDPAGAGSFCRTILKPCVKRHPPLRAKATPGLKRCCAMAATRRSPRWLGAGSSSPGPIPTAPTPAQ